MGGGYRGRVSCQSQRGLVARIGATFDPLVVKTSELWPAPPDYIEAQIARTVSAKNILASFEAA